MKMLAKTDIQWILIGMYLDIKKKKKSSFNLKKFWSEKSEYRLWIELLMYEMESL